MTDLTRRDAMLAATALATLVAAAPAAAMVDTPAAAPDGAAWDLSELYPSDAAWEAARQDLLKALPGLDRYKGTLGTSAASLGAAFKAASDLGRSVLRLYTYASLKADADLRIAPNQEKRQLATDLYSKYGEATAWMSPEVLTVGKAKIEGFLAADASLARFRFGLEDTLRQAPHTLSAEGEGILAAAVAPLSGPSDIHGQLAASDIPRPEVTLSTGEKVRLDDQGYTIHRQAPNRADRKLVFDSFWPSYGKFESSLGSTLGASIRGDIFNARARHYKGSLEASLASSNIPEAVYRTLIAETDKGLPVLHRYFALRQKMLKLPDLHYYDIYPPLVTLDRKFTVPEMRTLALSATAPLGKPYVDRLASATAAKWMDPLPRPGKYSGAYMNPGAYDVHPYLLLNLSQNYDGATTFAHEWGHAMHSLLANAAQPFELSNYPTFIAEIASTCNEQLLIHYMIDNARTKQEKLFYLGQQMENFRSTFFRQAMFAEFEAKAHDMAEAGEGISGESFTKVYLDLLKRYHGPGVTIDAPYAIEWAYVPHFYNAFYVFQYATSITGAVHFSQAILKGGATERDRYLSVLQAGGSDYGYNILAKAGLDMATAAPYQTLVALFAKTMDQTEALLG
ncbi:MAG: pepF [Sphingomonas bacterium]|nr:pepF [Sphingomonas bacterium]